MDQEHIADLFMRGQDCGQVVFEYAAQKLGIGSEEANRLASAFGGGTGVGGTCGAVIGAMMALGLKYGHKGPDDLEQRGIMIAKRAEFLERWKERYPSADCNDLLGDDIGTEEGLNRILEKGLLFDFCPRVAADAIDILDDMMS